MPPIDVTVNVPPFRSSSLLLPAFASVLQPVDVGGDRRQVLLVGVLHDRNDQPVRRGDRDADVVLVVQHDLAGGLVEGAVDDRHFLQCPGHGLHEEREVRQLHAGLGERVAELRAQPHEVGEVALVDVRVVRDLAASPRPCARRSAGACRRACAACPATPKSSLVVSVPGESRTDDRPGRPSARGRGEVVEQDAAAGPGAANAGEIDAELAGEQPHRRRRRRRMRRARGVAVGAAGEPPASGPLRLAAGRDGRARLPAPPLHALAGRGPRSSAAGARRRHHFPHRLVAEESCPTFTFVPGVAASDGDRPRERRRALPWSPCPTSPRPAPARATTASPGRTSQRTSSTSINPSPTGGRGKSIVVLRSAVTVRCRHGLQRTTGILSSHGPRDSVL